MVGHGSPKTSPGSVAFRLRFTSSVLQWFIPLTVLLCATVALGDQPTFRLRIIWGGGAERQWSGNLSLSEGTFDGLRPLGVTTDTPGSMEASGDKVLIAERSARSFDGLDVDVFAPQSASLTIVIVPVDARDESKTIVVPLSELVSGSRNEPLDQQGNRLLIQRAPGDVIRVELQRRTLVFAPGERVELKVNPHLTGFAPDTLARLKIELLRGRTSQQLFEDERELRVGADGLFPEVDPVTIELPSQEGVYDVQVSMTERGFLNRFNRFKRFVPARPTKQRKLQLVVIDPHRVPASQDSETSVLVDTVDPANPKWWERLARPLARRIPYWSQPGPLGNARSRVWPYQDRTYVLLENGGWQAYPLSIESPGTPHILEIEYPAGLHQTLGISVIESNAAGEVLPIGLDSGVFVRENQDGESNSPQQHRLLFWPRTRSPLILLTNRHRDSNAVFGTIRVTAILGQLPVARPDRNSGSDRLLAAYFAKPLFPENFSATEDLDSASGRSLDDWKTFYDGGTRLVEYLTHVGYNGAVISAGLEGSSIYPSSVLEPTPRYDTGAFFATGQDLMRKDVMEMLFLLFDREGLRLFPALQFTSPLPELEQILRRDGSDAQGIRLIDANGDSRMAIEKKSDQRPPYYNPLDERVQLAIINVVRELVDRYADHESFGGLAMQLSTDGYSQLPGILWGIDDRTINRFQRETGVNVPGSGPARFRERADYLSTNLPDRDQWLTWRAGKITQLQRKIHEVISSGRPGAKLLLASPELFNNDSQEDSLRPTLPLKIEESLKRSLWNQGIDLQTNRESSGIVLMRAQTDTPRENLSATVTALDIQDSWEVDRQFATRRVPATLLYYPPNELRLPGFDRVSPYGKENTYTSLVSHFSSSGHENRRPFIHSLATMDSQAFLVGGWMLPLGQEDSLRDIYRVYSALPAAKFTTVTKGKNVQPVVVRTLHQAGITYICLINDSPWPVTISLNLKMSSDTPIASLGARKIPELVSDSGKTSWTVPLEPFDLVGATLSQSDVDVIPTGVTLPEDVIPTLKQRIREISARADALKNPPPMDLPINPSFETPSDDDEILGWFRSKEKGISVVVDRNQAYAGRQSMQLSSERGPAWIRSEPFAMPKSGRLSMFVYLRIANASKQPEVRLALEAKHHGQPYYRPAPVGNSPETALDTKWARYYVPFDGLPTSGLTELRVGVDLMGPGEVWVDDVQMYDLTFNRDEQIELSKMIAQARLDLRDGRVSDCVRVLDSYWPRFLMTNVEPAPANVAAQPTAIPAPQVPSDNADQEEDSFMDRLRGMVPKMPRFN